MMADPHAPNLPNTDPRRSAARIRRMRIVGAVTLPLVVAWCAGAAWISLRYIRNLEIASGMAFFISVGLGGRQPDVVFNPTATVITRLSWLALMWLVGLWTAVAVVWALRARAAARWMLRVGGVLVLLASAATFAGIEILIHWGGFPPLHPFMIALICGCQSIFGVLLLAVTRATRRSVSSTGAP